MLDASLEVRSAVVYGSLIVILVFIPVFLLEGLAGSFFRPLALSYVLAILASLLVALIVTPALSLLLLPKHTHEREAPVVTRLKGRYRRLLPGLIAAPKRAIAIVAVSLAVTAAAFPFLGEEFLPNFQEYDFLMHWVEKPGTSLEAMRRVTVNAGRELMDVEGVRNFGAHIGRAEVADEVVGINFTELWISLDPSVDYETKVAEIQGVVDGYPGLTRDLLTYLRERIKEVLTGASATIVVRIFGPNLTQLAATAGEVGQALGSRRRRRRPDSPAADGRAAGRSAHAPGGRADCRRHAGAGARLDGHAAARHQGRRDLRRPEDLRHGRLERAGGPFGSLRHQAAADRHRQRRLRAARGGGRRDAGADAERDHARRRVAPDRRHDATCAIATWAPWRRTSRRRSRR